MGIWDIFTPEDQILSIDFNNPLRIIYAGRKKNKIFIKNALEENLPEDVFQMGQVINSELIINILRERLKNWRIKKAKVLLSIPAQNVVVRFINFPYMPEAEVKEALRWELEKYVPFPVEDVYYDFQILDTIERERNKEYRLLLVAAPSETIRLYLDIVNKVGLNPELIDISPFSAIRSVIKERKEVPNEVTLFIFSRYRFVDMVISKDKKPFFFRTISTKSWFEDKELDDLSKSYLLEDYLKEIQNNINLFYLQYPDVRIEKLILLGDNVLNKDFIELLEAMLGLTAEISPLSLTELGIQMKNKNIISIFQDQLPKWVVPLGLLIWGEV
jgi:type IV pilus assembly protein PilM